MGQFAATATSALATSEVTTTGALAPATVVESATKRLEAAIHPTATAAQALASTKTATMMLILMAMATAVGFAAAAVETTAAALASAWSATRC